MRFILLLFCSGLFTACNSSGKKDPNQQRDDTARMDDPPAIQKIEPVKGTAAGIPASITIKGTIQEVWKWNGNTGENIIITSIVPPYDDSQKNQYGEEGKTAELYAAHYTQKDGDYIKVWSLTESEKACPFDITCEFIRDAVSITDLDADQVAEITLMYKLTCRSDVSPAVLKLVMYEGDKRYSLKGLTWYGAPDESFEVTETNANLETLAGYKKGEDDFFKTWGRYESEQEFTGAPPEFLSHARHQWMRFVKENNE